MMIDRDLTRILLICLGRMVMFVLILYPLAGHFLLVWDAGHARSWCAIAIFEWVVD